MHVTLGDVFVWHRLDRYGGPIEFEVIKVTPRCFTGRARREALDLPASAAPYWTSNFRISDGRVIGNKHNRYWVRPKTDGKLTCSQSDASAEPQP